MSAATAPTAHLAQPSGTDGIEQDFLKAVARRARRIRGLVRRTVGYKNDALGLKQAALADEREEFPQRTNRVLVQSFAEWFEGVVRDELLEPTPSEAVRNGDHWTAEYVRRGYVTAWQQATGRLMQEGVSTSPSTVEAIIQLPVPRRQLRRLYQRAYESLRNISGDTAQTIREELARGLEAGENPRAMANRLTGEIEAVSKSRLRTLARTEVINSHTEATLDRYERAGADLVRHGEWADADDGRVCPICSALDGRDIPIGEMRAGTFDFEPSENEPDSLAGTYPLRPPAHPNCRCTIMPVVGGLA